LRVTTPPLARRHYAVHCHRRPVGSRSLLRHYYFHVIRHAARTRTMLMLSLPRQLSTIGHRQLRPPRHLPFITLINAPFAAMPLSPLSRAILVLRY